MVAFCPGWLLQVICSLNVSSKSLLLFSTFLVSWLFLAATTISNRWRPLWANLGNVQGRWVHHCTINILCEYGKSCKINKRSWQLSYGHLLCLILSLGPAGEIHMQKRTFFNKTFKYTQTNQWDILYNWNRIKYINDFSIIEMHTFDKHHIAKSLGTIGRPPGMPDIVYDGHYSHLLDDYIRWLYIVCHCFILMINLTNNLHHLWKWVNFKTAAIFCNHWICCVRYDSWSIIICVGHYTNHRSSSEYKHLSNFDGFS